MMHNHKACRKCVSDGSCLLQDNDEVEECQDVKEYEENNLDKKGVQ